MKKHNGSIEDLKALIQSAGFKISSCEHKGEGHQIRTEEGAIANWYPSTRKITYQGNNEAKEKLQNNLDAISGKGSAPKADSAISAVESPTQNSPQPVENKKVFVVHGHDVNARDQLELVLHKLGLNPFVLQNSSGGGLTIIEALEKEIGPRPEAARFGIVLLTPDDMGYSNQAGESAIQPRARQNVVLETGMLISALGRPNMAILVKGNLEVPSDANGIIYLGFDYHVKETVPRLAERLRESGFVISPQSISKASA